MRYVVTSTEIHESDGQFNLVYEAITQDGKSVCIAHKGSELTVFENIYAARESVEAAGHEQPEDFPPDDNA